MSLRTFFNSGRKGLCAIVFSAAFAMTACNDDSALRVVPYCGKESHKKVEEICNNPYEGEKCNPDIEEGCDDNCDGVLDDGCDDDGDGYCDIEKEIVYTAGDVSSYPGVCVESFKGCGESEECRPSLDCNDDNSSIHPGAVEMCNGVDDDCNHLIDEYFIGEGEECGIPEGLDGVGICRSGFKDCTYGQVVCMNAIPPRVAEECNALDDDCNGRVDEFVPPRMFCYHEWERDGGGNLVKLEPCGDLEGLTLEEIVEICPSVGVGTCTVGWETCTTYCDPYSITYEICEPGMMAGDKLCHNARVERPDVCDRFDNNCDGWADEDFDSDRDHFTVCIEECPLPCDCDDNDPLSYPGAPEIECSWKDENCDGIDDVFVDADEDLYSPQGGLCGPVDCNDNDPEMNPGLEEWCDCKDNDCDGQFDEGLYDETPIDFNINTDCSGSMGDDIGAVKSYFSGAEMLDCFSDEIITVTTTVVDDPPRVVRTGTIEGFQANYSGDIPGWCSGYERTLNVVAYESCMVEGMETHSICQAIDSMIPGSFRDPPIWRYGSDKYIVLVTDEEAQWYGSANYNQRDIAQLAADAGIVVDVYTLDTFNTFNLAGSQGFAYFETLTGGNIYDLQEQTANGTLGSTFAQSFIDRYCSN